MARRLCCTGEPRATVPGRGAARLAGLVLTGLVAALIATMPTGRASAQGLEPAALAQLRAHAAGDHRAKGNRDRDAFRKPIDVIAFLDIKPTSTVVEISPGAAAYWTEILAPYLREKGRYVAANPAPLSQASKANIEHFNQLFAQRLAADPARFSRVEIVEWAPERPDNLTPGSADFVLTFRNLHNWMDRGVVDKALASFHRVLKRGGILGIKDHRAATTEPQDPAAKSGYVRQDYTIEIVERAGFKLVASSEAVANPRDTKDHPAGVWALPPTFRLKDQDRDRYAAIGESDRFLLKFVKP